MLVTVRMSFDGTSDGFGAALYPRASVPGLGTSECSVWVTICLDNRLTKQVVIDTIYGMQTSSLICLVPF